MKSPKKTIEKILPQAGLNPENVKFWVAVSAYETAYANNYQTPWSSPVFTQNNNLFGMRLPSGNTLAVGDNLGHAVFPSVEDSAKDLVLYFKRLNWKQVNFNNTDALVAAMKAKGYFTADEGAYAKGVRSWYNKIYNQ